MQKVPRNAAGSAWGTGAPGGTPSPAQGGLGVRAQERGSESTWISLGWRGSSFANSSSSWAVLKNIPPPGAFHGPKHAPCCPVPQHGPAPTMAAPGAMLRLGLGIRRASPSPQHLPRHELLPSPVTRLCVLKEERRFAVYFGRHLHPLLLLQIMHKGRSLSVSL